jgi:hypothetical protein
MAATDSKQIVDAEEGKEVHHAGFGERVRHSISAQSIDENTKEGQIFSMNDVDPALDAKMRLVNNVSVA